MTTTRAFTDAPPPFDDPSADIIVRSAEGIDFRIHKLLLSLASPFFKEMFELPQPPIDSGEVEGNPRLEVDDTRDGIPVIFMYDDQNQACGQTVVEFILSSCHPTCLQSNKPFLDTHILGTVVDVGRRYRMDAVVKIAFRYPPILATNPFVLFAHACHRKLAEEATLAAKETLKFRIEDFPHDPALKLISGYQYHTLLKFHRQCGEATATLAQCENMDWIPQNTLRLFPEQHNPCSSFETYRDPMSTDSTLNQWNQRAGVSVMLPRIGWIPRSSIQQWWIDYMGSTSRALKSKPHSSTVDEPQRVDDAKGAACPDCAVKARAS